MKNVKIFIFFILILLGAIMIITNNKTYGNNSFISKKYNFKLLPQMHSQRSVGASLTLLKDGRVLITGGMKDSNNSTNSAEIYNPKTNKFSKVADMHFPRTNHASFLLHDGNVLITGGITYKNNTMMKKLKNAEIYDTKNNKFILIDNMDFAMGYPHIMRAKDDSIIVFEKCNEIEIFDENKYTFEPYKFNKYEKTNKSTLILKGLLLDNQNILLISASGMLNIFKNKNEQLEILSKLYLKPLVGQSYEILSNNKILVVGSDKMGETNPNNHYIASIYDIYNGNCLKSYKMNFPHDKFYTILLNDKSVLIAGNGIWHYGTFLTKYELSNKVEFYNNNKSFEKLPSRHSKGAVKMIKLNNGNVLMISNSRRPELLIIN